jgi:hypothetical protein
VYAAHEQINLHQIYSHTGVNLHRGNLTVVSQSYGNVCLPILLDRQLGLFDVLQIWGDQFLITLPLFIVIHGSAGAGARWMLWSKDLDRGWWIYRIFPDFIDGSMQWILVQGGTRTSHRQRQHAITTCALLLAAVLLIDLQNSVGDGASLDLGAMEVRRFFQSASMWMLEFGGGCGFRIFLSLMVLYPKKLRQLINLS